MQITLCSIDMRRIVKGLYLLSKKFFIIRIKKLVKKAISQRDLSTSKLHRLMRTTAVQDFSQLTGKIFIEKKEKMLNQAGLKKKY